MPGFIQVSVLDFKELPISSYSVKVSLGKVEHEALEKGIYSFPLVNLRDNLIISIEDSEGNKLSNSGVRTMSIIEKGIWDDLFPIEGGGFVHMKLEFILSDEERNRIRLMRETAMKKKQAEILASRLKNEESAKFLSSSLSRREVSDVLRATSSQDLQRSGLTTDDAKDAVSTPVDDTSVKALESSDGINEESFQRQSFTNATDKREETSFFQTTETIDEKETVVDTKSRDSSTALPNSSGNLVENLDEQNIEEKTSSDVNTTSEENTSSPLSQETNTVIPSQQVEVRENLPEDNETRDFVKIITDSSKLLDNPVEKTENQNIEEKSPNLKKLSKESKFPPPSQEAEAKTVKNTDRIFQEPDVPKISSRSTIAEKIKSFSPKIAGEPDKQGSSEKTPRSIKNMISVFESSISQDRVPLKPLSTKSFRVGTSRLLKDNPVKDYYENSESSQEWLKTSEVSSSTRLRNSFSTGDLRKDLLSIITKEDQVGFGNNFVEPSETNPTKSEIFPKDSIIVASIDVNNEEKIALTEPNVKDLPNSPQEGVSNDEKVAVTETNTKDLSSSPQESVRNEKKFAPTENDANKLLESCDEDATVSGRMHLDDIKDKDKENVDGQKTSKDDLNYFDHDTSGQRTFLDEKRHFCITAQGDSSMSLFGEKKNQENIVASIPEIIVKGETDAIVIQDEEKVRILGNSSPKNTDEEACNLSVGQAIKIALVVGFGVLVLLFRQRDSGKGKKKENNVAIKNQVFINKRGSIQEQRRRISGLKLS